MCCKGKLLFKQIVFFCKKSFDTDIMEHFTEGGIF